MTLETLYGANPDVKIIRLRGPLTMQNFSEFQELTRQEPYPKVMLVDLEGVPYVDSAALGSLVALHISCEEHGRKYALVGANARLNNLFDLANVRGFLVTYASVAEAEAQLA